MDILRKLTRLNALSFDGQELKEHKHLESLNID